MENVKNPAPAESADNSASVPSSEDYFADFDFGNLEVNMEQMLKSGVHFGHQKARKNPKMEEYIFSTKKGINILDLQKTLVRIEEAMEFAKKTAKEGKKILFVGTKKQAKSVVKSAAIRADMPFIVERWLGGTFTNFRVIRGRVKHLISLEEGFAKGEMKKYTKFEQMKKAEEMGKLEKKLGGIKNMADLPGAIFAMDVNLDRLAINEARRMKIPVIAITDTNSDPSLVDYPIPGNDDAVSSIRLIVAYIAKAIIG